jgi:hypothetical protein
MSSDSKDSSVIDLTNNKRSTDSDIDNKSSKKQKIDEQKLGLVPDKDVIIDESEFGIIKTIKFQNNDDIKQTQEYNAIFLNIIPVYRDMYLQSKESTFLIPNNYYNIINIVYRLYIIKYNNIRDITSDEFYDLVEFINKYMVVSKFGEEFLVKNDVILKLIQKQFKLKNFEFVNNFVNKCIESKTTLLDIADNILQLLIRDIIKVEKIKLYKYLCRYENKYAPDVNKSNINVDTYLIDEPINPEKLYPKCDSCLFWHIESRNVSEFDNEELSKIHSRYTPYIFKLLLKIYI